jgi:hypothetical protein
LEVKDRGLSNKGYKDIHQKVYQETWEISMFIKQYELDGDSKFVGEDGSRSHAIRHEFQS